MVIYWLYLLFIVSYNVFFSAIVITVTAWKMSVFGVILVRIFPYSDWIRTRITPNRSTFYAVCLWRCYRKHACKLCFVAASELLHYPAGNCMYKANDKNTRSKCEICSKLTIKTPEWRHWFILMSLLLTLNIFHSLF